jgi:hypothetical protein
MRLIALVSLSILNAALFLQSLLQNLLYCMRFAKNSLPQHLQLYGPLILVLSLCELLHCLLQNLALDNFAINAVLQFSQTLLYFVSAISTPS